MKTTITKSFSVDHPLEVVWEHLSDPTKIVACVPGAKLTETIDDRNYKGTVTMKIGPVATSFNGKITLSQVDETTHSMKIEGKGTDTRGKGSANMVLSAQLDGGSEQTEVSSDMDISITGKLAQFGSRMITDVSDQVFKQFVANFHSQLDRAASATVETGTSMSGSAGGRAEAGELSAAPQSGGTDQPAKAHQSGDSIPEAKPLNALSLFFNLLWNKILGLFGKKS